MKKIHPRYGHGRGSHMNQQGKCYKCGGFLAVNDAEDAVICPFCNQPIIVERAIKNFTGDTPKPLPKPFQPTPDSFFDVTDGVLVSCNCFTEADIHIPDGVRAIGETAFQGMNNIQSIHIPAGTKFIGSSAFSGCKNLHSVIIPEGVEAIDGDVFNGCTGLKQLHLPNSITKMEAGALSGCTGLESVNIPAHVETLPWRVFEGCTSLKFIVIPRRVKTIDDYAFAECTALEEVRFECRRPEKNADYGVKRIGMNAFLNCTALRRIELPETLEYIGNQAFQNCTDLHSLVIPKSVKAIYPLAFANCTALESVTFNGKTMLYKGSNPYKYGNNVATFYNCPKLLHVSYSALQPHFWAFPAYMQANEPVFIENGKCRHCGGSFNGKATKICTVCNTPKDY